MENNIYKVSNIEEVKHIMTSLSIICFTEYYRGAPEWEWYEYHSPEFSFENKIGNATSVTLRWTDDIDEVIPQYGVIKIIEEFNKFLYRNMVR